MSELGMLGSLPPYLPTLLYLLLLLMLGYFVGNFVENLVRKLAETMGVKRQLRFGLEKELKKYGFSANLMEFLAKFFKYLIYLLTIMIALDSIGVGIAERTLMPVLVYSPNVVAAFLIVVIGAIVTEFAFDIIRFKLQEYGLDQLAEESGMKIQFSSLIALFLKYFIYVTLAVMAMAQLGFQVLSVIILLSIFWFIFTVTLASLFVLGAKDLVPSMFTGLYIKSTRCFRKGDTIEFSGVKGKVVNIGLFATEILSASGACKIPNSLIVRNGYCVLKTR